MSAKNTPVVITNQSAERDSKTGKEYLAEEPWQKMGTKTVASRATEMMDKVIRKISGNLEGDELLKVSWLSGTLFFVVGGYWLLRSLKDPIMSAIDGVEYIPQAKIASLFVVFGLVLVYNKLLDMYPKHQLFYMMGCAYGVAFAAMGLLLLHPTIGLPNTKADPTRWLGWLSYVTIESFGSMVVQCYWALVNSSVNVDFAKKNFGLIVAGAQIGSILGPTLSTQASVVGVPALYLCGSGVMFLMVGAMYFYIQRFGVAIDESENAKKDPKKSGKEEGIMEGFYLLYEHDYVKGIFCVSSLYMIQVTVIDYMMKVLAKQRYTDMYPDDPQAALRAFATFMGYFGQTTNTISFLFSFFGTGMIIKRFGLTWTLIAFPALLLICTVFVWVAPNIWVVFTAMMVIKGMTYALNNPTKEILYQMTSTNIKFKCKSWIDTFGQRSSKAAGSLITNQFATNIVALTNWGSVAGVGISLFLVWISNWMGKQFEQMVVSGEKVGEPSKALAAQLAAMQSQSEDTSCSLAEEGQDEKEHPPTPTSTPGKGGDKKTVEV